MGHHCQYLAVSSQLVQQFKAKEVETDSIGVNIGVETEMEKGGGEKREGKRSCRAAWIQKTKGFL